MRAVRGCERIGVVPCYDVCVKCSAVVNVDAVFASMEIGNHILLLFHALVKFVL